jgi:hypothetical protein
VKPEVVAEAKVVIAMMPFPSSTLLCPERYASARFCVLETVAGVQRRAGLGNGPGQRPISASDMDEQKVLTSRSDQRPQLHQHARVGLTKRCAATYQMQPVQKQMLQLWIELVVWAYSGLEVSLKPVCLHPRRLGLGSICWVSLRMNLRLHIATRFFVTAGQSKLNTLYIYLALASTYVPFIVSPIGV